MRIETIDLGETCISKIVSFQRPDCLNLIAAAAPDFRFFIEINRDYSGKEDYLTD